VIIYSHFTTADASGPIRSYYSSGSSQQKKAVKHISKGFPRNSRVCNEFAWTFVSFEELPRNNECNLTGAFALIRPLDPSHFKDPLEDTVKDKHPKFRFSLLLRSERAKVQDVKDLGNPIHIVRLVQKPRTPPTPRLHLYHTLQLHFVSASFVLPKDEKGRNFFASVSLQRMDANRNWEKLKAIRSARGEMVDEWVTAVGTTGCQSPFQRNCRLRLAGDYARLACFGAVLPPRLQGIQQEGDRIRDWLQHPTADGSRVENRERANQIGHSVLARAGGRTPDSYQSAGRPPEQPECGRAIR
jgi:hypothetical protein